jgi:hypothetical protein
MPSRGQGRKGRVLLVGPLSAGNRDGSAGGSLRAVSGRPSERRWPGPGERPARPNDFGGEVRYRVYEESGREASTR